MKCPYCPSQLSLAEYAWTHRHDMGPRMRFLGKAMMTAGAIEAACGLLVVTGVVRP